MTRLTEDWSPFLKKISIFSPFQEDVLSDLRTRLDLRSLPSGATLFHQGDPGDSLIILLSGEIRLSQLENGQDRFVSLMGRRGDTVGEMALLTGRPRPVTARVERDAEYLVLQRKDFEGLLQSNPNLALPLARQLSEQLAQASRWGAAPPQEARTFVLFTPLPGADRQVLLLNLAVSLLEQTRRRVVLVDVPDHGDDGLARPLGLPDPAPEGGFRPEDLMSPEALRPFILHHPSGLDVLTVPRDPLNGPLFKDIYPLLHTLRRQWDFVLLSLGGSLPRASRVFAEEADRVLVTWPEDLPDSAKTLWKDLEGFVPVSRLDRIELPRNGPPRRNRPGHFRIPWGDNLAVHCLNQGHPFLPSTQIGTLRAIDRMSRHLAGLRIGLAMGSGAALGYSIIGILRVLERNGIFPDLVSGTSMGALIGGFYCMGQGPDELEKIALSITKMKLWSLIDFTAPWLGVIMGREVLSFLKSIIGEATFEDLALPFACVATDINTGEERILRHGGVADAVRASLSLPFFFQPHFHQGRYLVDGGLVNPVPSSVIKAMGADIRIGINITTKPAVKRFPGFKARLGPLERLIVPNVFRVMMKTLYTMQYGIAQTRAHDSHVVLAPDLSNYTWMEFHKAKEIIKIGEENAELMLAKIRTLMPFHADQCRIPLQRGPAVKPF